MFKNINLFVFVIFFEFIISQALYHDSLKEIPAQIPFTIYVLTDFNDSPYIAYKLFYKIQDQLSFFQQPMIANGDGNYISTIPPNHITSGYIEYFIQLEMDNGEVFSLPLNSPEINPYIVKVIDDAKTGLDIWIILLKSRTAIAVQTTAKIIIE